MTPSGLSGYSFFHLVYGQCPPVLSALSIEKYGDLGFPKRFNLLMQTQRQEDSPRENSTSAKKLTQGYVDWLCKHALPHEGDTVPDKFAWAILDQIFQATKDFLSQREVPKYWREKLEYKDTDLLRWASFCMRIRRYLGYLCFFSCRPAWVLPDVMIWRSIGPHPIAYTRHRFQLQKAYL